MNKQSNHKNELLQQQHTRNLERHHNHMTRNFGTLRMTTLTYAIRSMFSRGLPAGWGSK